MQSPNVSATPILDLIEPLPRKGATSLRGAVVGFLIGALGTGLLLFGGSIPFPNYLRPVAFYFRVSGYALRFWDHRFFLGGMIVLWAVFSVSILLHELGHFLAGRAVGFSLHSLQVGPLRISFEFGNLRVRVVSSAGLGGFAAMHIRTCVRLRKKLAKFIAAGPGVNLACAAVALVLVRFPKWLPNIQTWSTLALFGLTSLFCCVLSLLPIRVASGFLTDGMRLLMLLRPNRDTLRWYAIMGIGMQQQAGRRARDWNQRWVALASSNPEQSRDSLLGTYIAYVAANDRNDEAAAAAYLEHCLRSLPPSQVVFRDAVVNEAAIFQAWFRRDAEKAKAWFARLKKPAHLNPILRIRAEVARKFVQGEIAAAYEAWNKGLSIIEGFRDPIQREAVRASWLEWKQEMQERETAAITPVLVQS